MTKAVMWSSDKGDLPFDMALKNNLAATADPTSSDDSSLGYEVGSMWVNTTGSKVFTCSDATPGAAVWLGDAGNSVNLTGDQTIAGIKTFSSPPVMSGASIVAATIPNAALAANGGLAALIGAGLGASANYTKATSGAQTLLAGAVGDRSVIIVVDVSETFANGNGAQPTFQIGQTGTAAKFADTTAFTNKTAGTVLTFAGTLTSGDDLIVTGVAGTGTTETGAISVTVLALPAA